jgi:hypothetical protein
MNTPRWRILDMLILVLFVGIAVGGIQLLWTPTTPNAEIKMSLFLAVLTFACLGARFCRSRIQRLCVGFALYGCLHLVFVLRCGFKRETFLDAENLAMGSMIGLVVGALCAIVSFELLPPPTIRETTEQCSPAPGSDAMA